MGLNTGSTFFNYEKFHSTVLMTACDAKHCFSFVDIGSHGRDNDAVIFSQSELAVILERGNFPIPESSNFSSHMFPGTGKPKVLIGDDIFPLKGWLIKSFPGKSLTETQAVYNCRLSRCRRTIENTFGILSGRWSIFRRPFRANVNTVNEIVQATAYLHNYGSIV